MGGDGPRGARAVLIRALALARRLGFDYTCFRIYTLALAASAVEGADTLPSGYRIAPVASADLDASPYADIRACRSYVGADARLFGVFRPDGVLACVQCFWFGTRLARVAFWPVGASGAASMHLVCIEAERGRRLASCLKRDTAERMRASGFTWLYSRIWWSNRASLRVSERAGWTHVGTVLGITLPGRREPLRFGWRKPDPPAHARAREPEAGPPTLY